MRALRMAFSQLMEGKGKAFFMMAELAVTLVIFNVFAAQLSSLFALNHMYEAMDMEQVWTSNEANMEKNNASVPAGVVQVRADGEVVILPPGDTYNMSADNPTVYLWPQAYYEQFSLKLHKGNWMKEPRAGCLNIIVPKGLSGGYKAGDMYTRTVWFTLSGGRSESHEVDIYVCGVLADSMVPTPGGGARYDNTRMLGLDLTGMLGNVPNDVPSYYFRAAAPLPDDGKAAMESFAWPLESSYEANKDSLLVAMRLPIILSIALLCFCLSAFLGYNLLNLLDKEKRMAVYFMCGARIRDVVRMKLCHDALLVGIPMALSLIILGVLVLQGIITALPVLGMAGSYALVLLLFGISSFLFIRQINQRSIVSYIHKWL